MLFFRLQWRWTVIDLAGYFQQIYFGGTTNAFGGLLILVRTLSLTLALFVLVGPWMQAPPPPAPPAPPPRIFGVIPETGDATIGGVVRRVDTGEPLAAAPVTL